MDEPRDLGGGEAGDALRRTTVALDAGQPYARAAHDCQHAGGTATQVRKARRATRLRSEFARFVSPGGSTRDS